MKLFEKIINTIYVMGTSCILGMITINAFFKTDMYTILFGLNSPTFDAEHNNIYASIFTISFALIYLLLKSLNNNKIKK